MQGIALGSPAPVDTMNPMDEKLQAQHVEYEEKVQVKGDYSGAVAKTSPEEKKLVKKLDIWIMVNHFHEYLLNTD
jgi:hypothetical protein